jgi:glycerol dehydrogenase
MHLENKIRNGDKLLKKIFISPTRYVQGKNAVEDAGIHCKLWGSHPYLIGSPTSLSVIGGPLQEALDREDIPLVGTFSQMTRCTESMIIKGSDLARSSRADLIIGAGGGVVVDAAKAVAHRLTVPVITIPTVASTNADISAESVIYDDQGRYVTFITYPENPKAVIVDTSILASAPPRFLVAGMGDALACRFEAEACAQSQAVNNPGGQACDTVLAISRLCFDTLMEKGEQAVTDVQNSTVTPAVDSVIEAIKLMSGIGFESGGLAAAHAIHNGFTQAHKPQGLHGDIVAFSVIAQLFLEKRSPDLIEDIARWCKTIGLPTTLHDLQVPEDSLHTVSEAACTPGLMKNEPVAVTPQDVEQAIRAAHRLGSDIS